MSRLDELMGAAHGHEELFSTRHDDRGFISMSMVCEAASSGCVRPSLFSS